MEYSVSDFFRKYGNVFVEEFFKCRKCGRMSIRIGVFLRDADRADCTEISEMECPHEEDEIQCRDCEFNHPSRLALRCEDCGHAWEYRVTGAVADKMLHDPFDGQGAK